MTYLAPLTVRWTGEALQPVGRSAKEADAYLVIGQTYQFVEHQPRSIASHRQYFASLHDAWANLPEDKSERFPTSEHLRAFALIKCGYATQRQLVASSKAEAHRLAAFIKPMSEYALVTVSESVVSVWEAESQSFRAMGRERFQKSKSDVLDYVASLIGVTTDNLQQNAGKAA